MFNKNNPAKGYNTYVEHSISNGELGKVLSMTLSSKLTCDEKNRGRTSPVIPFCVSEMATNAQDEYLHEFIKGTTKVHVYVMVPGTNIFNMIHDIMVSAKVAAKVYVLMLKEHVDDSFKAIGGWTETEMTALETLRGKLVQDMKIVVIDDIDTLAQSVIFSITSGEMTNPTYRSPKEDAIRKASESAAMQIIDANKHAVN